LANAKVIVKSFVFFWKVSALKYPLFFRVLVSAIIVLLKVIPKCDWLFCWSRACKFKIFDRACIWPSMFAEICVCI